MSKRFGSARVPGCTCEYTFTCRLCLEAAGPTGTQFGVFAPTHIEGTFMTDANAKPEDDRCKHCLELIRFHRLLSVQSRCRARGGNGFGDPLLPEDLKEYNRMVEEDRAASIRQNEGLAE